MREEIPLDPIKPWFRLGSGGVNRFPIILSRIPTQEDIDQMSLTLSPGPVRDTLEKNGIVKPPKVPAVDTLVEAAVARGFAARYSAEVGAYQVRFVDLATDQVFEYSSDVGAGFEFQVAATLARALDAQPQQGSLFTDG